MPTTFAKTIDGNDIYAKRAECDAAGNDLSTTYATKGELPTVDQTYDGTSTNPQSGAAIAGALASYTPTASLATVATTGDFADLTSKPTVKPLVAGSNITITENTNDITIAATGGGTTYTAGDGIDITSDVISADVDGTTIGIDPSTKKIKLLSTIPSVDQTYNSASTNAQSGTAVAGAISTKEDAFDVGTGLEMDTSGSTPTLQVEAPVDIVAGPGIAIDNPDGNTLRVSQAANYEVTLFENASGATTNIVCSEKMSNFDRVRFYLYPSENTINSEYATEFAGSSTIFRLARLQYNDGGNYPFVIYGTYYSTTDSKTITIGQSEHIWFSSSWGVGGTGSTSPIKFVKIVGINRIAND